MEKLKVTHELKEKVEVFSTKEYTMFEFAKFNRPVSPAHVNKMKISLTEYGQLVPLLVYTQPSGKLLILDGQHKYLGCVDNEMCVEYQILNKKLNRNDLIKYIAELNAQHRKWYTSDYVNAFYRTNTAHSVLKGLHEKYASLGIGYRTLAAAMLGVSSHSRIEDQIKRQDFKIINDNYESDLKNYAYLLKAVGTKVDVGVKRQLWSFYYNIKDNHFDHKKKLYAVRIGVNAASITNLPKGRKGLMMLEVMLLRR